MKVNDFETCEITFGYIESLNFDIYKLYIHLGHKFLQNKLIVPKISITSQLFIKLELYLTGSSSITTG